MAAIKQEKIAKFRPQRRNLNRHKQRGMGTLETSMRKLGYVAPMTAAITFAAWPYVSVFLWQSLHNVRPFVVFHSSVQFFAMTEVCELVRVAMNTHKSNVSQAVSSAIRLLKKQSPGLRLIVSFADPEHGHIGGIYQSMNWFYAGMTTPADEWIVNGKRWHGRALRHEKPAHLTTAQAAMLLDKNSKKILGSSKHRYLYPLDRAMRKQIAPLAKPYPKRDSCVQSIEGDTVSIQPTGEGSIPSDRL